MDNKYGLGSAKVAHAHHEAKHKHTPLMTRICAHCGHDHLTLCPTMNDHYCAKCGQYQNDVPLDYSSGHSADY